MEYTKKMNNKLRKEQIKKTIENKLFILEQQVCRTIICI